MRCHYTKDPKTGKRIFIPGCWSMIHMDEMDPNICNCPERGYISPEEQIIKLKAQIEKLKQQLKQKP